MNPELVSECIHMRSVNLDLGSDLPVRARTDLGRVVLKHFDRLHGASIHIARERRLYHSTINVEAAGAGLVTSHGRGSSANQAFDADLKKCAKQLRRKKRALDDRRTTGP